MKTYLIICFVFLYASASGKVDSIAIAKVDGIAYKAVFKNNETLSIFDSKGKTVLFLKSKDLELERFSDLKFEDFNGDGYKDLIINHYSNVPNRQDIVLYDKYTKKFVLIKDFSDYPDAVRLKGTSLFYSYHRSGCADDNWDSDLFKIVNFKIVKIGNISGRDCVDAPDKPGIYITKINKEHKLLIRKFPITEPEKYKDGKWGLIAWYWERNYKIFN